MLYHLQCSVTAHHESGCNLHVTICAGKELNTTWLSITSLNCNFIELLKWKEQQEVLSYYKYFIKATPFYALVKFFSPENKHAV